MICDIIGPKIGGIERPDLVWGGVGRGLEDILYSSGDNLSHITMIPNDNR